MEVFEAFEAVADVIDGGHDAAPSIPYYVDEEEALGFHIWVAELELLVGQAKGAKQDVEPVAAMELLQKLQVTIDSSDKALIREYQRRCESALEDILLKGTAPPVRRLICACFARLYVVGDSLPLYSRVASLQTFLGSKEALARKVPLAARLGALQALAALASAHGRSLASSAPESLALAVKHATRQFEVAARLAALQLVAAVVGGLGGGDRSSAAIQADALKAAARVFKESRDSDACLAVAGVLRAVTAAGGAALWAANGRPYEEAVALCVSLLDDPSAAAGDAAGAALGDLAAAAGSPAAAEAGKALEKKPAKKAALEKLQGDAFTTCLVSPFVEAAKADRRRSLRALSQAWLAYLAHMQEGGDEDALVGLAVKAIEALAEVGNACGDRLLLGSEVDAGQGLGSGELPAAQAAILYVLRVGVIEQMGETGQRALLEALTALAASVLGGQVPVAAVTLETIGLLLEALGEIAPETTALLQEPLAQKLTGSHFLLRAQAAAALSALAVAEPSSASRLLAQQLNGLQEASAQLASLMGPFGAQSPPADPPQGCSHRGSGTPRGLGASEREKLKPAMDAVHGHALGAAALLVASTRLPLGVPGGLARGALELAERLIRRPGSSRAAGHGVEREAGYTLLSALCISAGPDLMKPAEVLELWQPALSAESAAAIDVRRFLSAPSTEWEAEASQQMWWRAASLEALQAFVLGPLAGAPRAEAARLQETIAALLAPTLDIISSSPPLQEAARGKSGPGPAFVAAAAQLQLRLMEAYLALPDAAAFATEHEALSKLCARAFRSATGAGTAQAVAAGALRRVLNHQDDVLEPWAPGRDPLQDALAAYAGAPGGPLHHPWEAGLPYSFGYLGTEAAEGGLVQRSHQPLPQPRSLSAALLEAQLTLLGSLLAVVSQPNQLQILDVLNAAAAEGAAGKGRRERPDPARRHTAVTCVCAAALAGLDTIARKYRGEVGSRDEVAARAAALADSVLAVAGDNAAGDAALQRSAAEMFAFASCIGSTGFAAALVRSLAQAMAETASAPRRAALALAVGCVVRSKGGIALQSTLNLVADTYLAVAAVCAGPVQLWLLHGLWLTANAAGPAFLPHVGATLAHAVQVLMAEENAVVAGLLPAVGRLANALVAVLGPELMLGSPAYCRCRAIIREMQATAAAVGRPDDAPAAALETVSYAQMLVLFAPQAVPAAAHLPLLLDTLPSRQPTLRRAAALTLRHLAERDATALLAAAMEGRLFRALDAETDGEIAGQLRATLRTLLHAGVPSQPSYWLQVCSQVALAAAEKGPGLGRPGSGRGTGGSGFRGGLDEGLMEGADDGDAGEAAAQPGAADPHARGPSLPLGGPAATASAGGSRPGAAPRLRTRLFAAKCILEIPVCVGTDPRHLDATASSGGSGGGDWLVAQLQVLIDAGFKMATGPVEALRPLGVHLLQAVLEKFGAAEDPLLPGHLLLEQYQAQFVSALRSALTLGAEPTLAAAGASLAAAFLEAGMATGDSVVLRRLLGLLAAPLATWDSDERQEVYAEWVGVCARVSLLEAHAQCAAFAAARPREPGSAIIRECQAPHARVLAEQWAALLQDWAVLGSRSAAAAAVFSPAFLPPPAAAVLPRVADAVERAAPASLLALSALLSSPGSTSEPVPEGARAAAQQLLDICHLAVAQASSRLASRGVASAEALHAAAAHLLLTALVALGRLVAAESSLLGDEDLENVVVLVSNVLQQVLRPLLTAVQPGSSGDASDISAAFAAAAAILAAAGSAGSHRGSSNGTARHLDDRVAEASLCAITIALSAPENGRSPPAEAASIDRAVTSAFEAAEAVCGRECHLTTALLSAAIKVLQTSSQDAQMAAARGFLERVAGGLGGSQGEPQRSMRSSGGTPAAPPLLAATLGSLADVAQECLSQAGSTSGRAGEAAAQSARMGQVIGLLVSMGAELQSRQEAVPARGSGTAPAGRGPAAAAGAGGNGDEDDDDFDAFEEAAPEQPGEDRATSEGDASAADVVAEAQGQHSGAAADADLSVSAGPEEGSDHLSGGKEALDRPEAHAAEDGGSGGGSRAQPGSPTGPAAAAQLHASGNGSAGGSGSNGLRASADWAARERCLKVLEACCGCSAQPAFQAAALQAVRGALQKSQQNSGGGDGGAPSAVRGGLNRRHADWAWACAARTLPAAAAEVHGLMRGGNAAALGAPELLVVAETMKLLTAALPSAGERLGPLITVLLTLIVEMAAPEGTPNVALRDMAVKLVSLVAVGPSAAAFQAAIAALPPEAKQRLQGAIKASSAAPQRPQPSAVGFGRAAGGAPPTISLQNFALKS